MGLTKKAWCCHNMGDGCEFNCDAGSNNWERDWSDEKKKWCCVAESVGCTTTMTSTFSTNTATSTTTATTTARSSTSTTTTTITSSTSTMTSSTCSAKMSKHLGWCQRFCNSAAEECKPLCPERCSVGTCPCQALPRKLVARGKQMHKEKTAEKPSEVRRLESTILV